MDYARLASLFDHWVDCPGYPLEYDFPQEEYTLRISRARKLLAAAGLDALVVTSDAVGQWFTSSREPHEWHDQCQTRSAWYILTSDCDDVFMTPILPGSTSTRLVVPVAPDSWNSSFWLIFSNDLRQAACHEEFPLRPKDPAS